MYTETYSGILPLKCSSFEELPALSSAQRCPYERQENILCTASGPLFSRYSLRYASRHRGLSHRYRPLQYALCHRSRQPLFPSSRRKNGPALPSVSIPISSIGYRGLCENPCYPLFVVKPETNRRNVWILHPPQATTSPPCQYIYSFKHPNDSLLDFIVEFSIRH
jgi:hypothetical protein